MLMQSCCLVVCFIDQQTDGVVTVGKNSPRILRQPEFLYCLSESYTENENRILIKPAHLALVLPVSV
ncbi:hypothetical protein OUZ56_007926 [Daphnia magna]|uniref:Uncharacterized protein n=1 Tax=Daphnia magna TaxID=35525 RepID=A0ABR0ABR0_9CRUS|nr:hypothetical protein OUZ56_007926 [Daphnia magna]